MVAFKHTADISIDPPTFLTRICQKFSRSVTSAFDVFAGRKHDSLTVQDAAIEGILQEISVLPTFPRSSQQKAEFQVLLYGTYTGGITDVRMLREFSIEAAKVRYMAKTSV